MATAAQPPLSRNAPCPCGSGKRYKDCHGSLGAPPAGAAASAASGIDELLRRAEEALARGEHAAAEAAWHEVLALDSEHPEALFHLGNCERECGRHADAIGLYERALKRASGHPGVLTNLGIALEAIGEPERAEACYRAVLVAAPYHADALGNLANVLSARDAFKETAAVYDRLFSIRRDLPAAVWIRRAMAQNQSHDVAGAVESYYEAALRDPDDMQVQLHLATLLIEKRAFSDGELALRRALELDPGNRYALSMLAHTRQWRCAWDGLSELIERIRSGLQDAEVADTKFAVMPFATLAMPLSALEQLRASQRWARTIADKPPPRPEVRYASGERLRVAFVTGNMKEHPTMHLSLEFWEKIDRSRLEMFAYSLSPDDGNPFLRRAREAFEHFADASQDSFKAIAQRIRADRIGILIDRNGYTLNSRERIFPLRPAQIQVNCIGFPGTMGAAWYDYIFTDHYTVPEELQRYYSERPLYMPHMAFPSDTTRLAPGVPPSRAACGLPERGFVFCCFNNAFKILPDVFAIWMRLLTAVPHSVLWLMATSSAEARQNLRREAASAGVDPDRIIFAPIVPVGDHVARNAAADLFLDSYPYGAHTTANDALLAALPVVTCAGDAMVSRIAASQLHAIGLPELVTKSFADYESLALTLATEPQLLQTFRARLAANRGTYPLFDMARYARDFEDAMHGAWASRHNLSRP